MIYEAIITDDRVEWVGERPGVTGATRVTIRVEEPAPEDRATANRQTTDTPTPSATGKPLEEMDLKEIFEELVRLDPFRDIDDPVAWQREIRKDRPLPGRED